MKMIRELCDAIKLQLERAGYETDCCGQGQEAFIMHPEYPYDVIILDRMLPQMDGLGVLGGLRRMNITTPVIITTALDGINDRIDGLDASADDYLVKPYAVEELLARIRALTRRPGNFRQSPSAACSNISLDPEKRGSQDPGNPAAEQTRIRPDGIPDSQYGPGPPQGLILSYIWGPDSDVEEGNLDNYIYFLRRRLKSIGALPQIKTVHGIGYRLEIGGTHD